jgi:dinuclear metal center YbgI/SA1388 family protein
MEIQAFVLEMEAIAPPALAEPCDEGRIGLVVEGTQPADVAVAALDATVRVAEKAAELGADVLVVHHPPFFAPMTRIEGGTARFLRVVLRHGLHVYAMHTNFDHAPGGINDCLADLLGLSERVPLGLGLVGRCSTDPDGLAAVLGPLRVWGDVGRIRRLAVVGGSGFDPELIEEAAALGADAFLSSEMRHHIARDAPIPCIESTHYALESPGMRALADRMGWAYIDDPPYLQHCG